MQLQLWPLVVSPRRHRVSSMVGPPPYRACPRCGELFATRADFDKATRFRGWHWIECECNEGCPECRTDEGKLPVVAFRIGVWAHAGCGGEMLDEGRPLCGIMAAEDN